MKYNLIIIDDKIIIPYLNISEQKLYDVLWDWSYEDDLFDWIEENNPNEEELEQLIFKFIEENMFHKWEDDDICCFAFVNDGIIKEYEIDDNLYDFVKSKIKEHYD